MKLCLAMIAISLEALMGCQPDAEVLPRCSAGVLNLRGRVLNGGASDGGSEGVPNALLAIERDGLYVTNPDTSRANPSYVYGGQADVNGNFSLNVPCGTVGLHVFTPGFRYGSAKVKHGGVVDIKQEPLLARDARPTLNGATLSLATVSPGAAVTIKVNAAAASFADPLSEEILAVAPALGMSMALDPPSRGSQGGGFSDGVWSRTFAAPKLAGSYVYTLVGTSEGCISSDQIQLTLEVR